jgi:hypothetical protein
MIAILVTVFVVLFFAGMVLMVLSEIDNIRS